jgi:F-type H+-transporting ATPase subunit b
MLTTLTYLASTEPAAASGITSALGIDWKMLIIQIVAFLVLLWLLSRFVYPWLMKSVDERQASIEAGAKAATEAQAKAEKAQQEVTKLLDEARAQAGDIVLTAKEEATAAIEAAESKAKQRAEVIVASAKEQLNKDVLAAKKELRNETIDLVAAATEKVIGASLTAKVDDKLIAKSIEEAR